MLRHARRALAAVLVTLVVIVAATGPVAANFPGRNGQIVFMRFTGENESQIWVANSDLTHQRQITTGPSSSAFPTWSPDGSRIAFQSNRTDPDLTDDYEIQDIFTMRADGSDVRQVTDLKSDTEKPSWSPDGRWLLFASSGTDYPRTMGIYTMRSDGSGRARQITHLTGPSFWQELARFSPDGKSIEYTEYRPPAGPDQPELSAIMIARADGSRPRAITPWELHAGDADWSPDGRRLVFAGRFEEHFFIQTVMVVDADGKHLRNLTTGDGLDFDGDVFLRYQESFNTVWSPDGKKILFVRASYTDADGFDMGLMTMKPDGSHLEFLSSLHAEEHQPEWGTRPDTH